MERRRLGSTGAHVGAIALSTATWGQGTDGPEAAEQVQMLVDAGGDLVELTTGTPGLAIARAALVDPGIRRRTFVALRQPVLGSQASILASLDEAIEEAGVGHVDLWTLAGWDEGVPWHELIAAMSIAISSGRVHYVGWAPQDAWQAALIGGGLMMHPQRVPLAAMSLPYSLLDRGLADEATHVAAALESSLLAAGPLAAGVLTGKYRHSTPPDSRGAGERFGARIHYYRGSWARPVVDGLCAAAEGLGTTPASLAIAWVLGRPMVAACLTGARTTHQWRSALAQADFSLPPEIRQALDEVSARATPISHDGEAEITGD